jgi:REP element-mobilizing transposase RayT
MRMAGYDYAQAGIYAFTVIVDGRRCCLGEVVDHEFVSSEAGAIVCETWERLPRRFPTIALDAFVVMPNHVHGIVFSGTNPAVMEEVAMNGDATNPGSLVASRFIATPAAGDIARVRTPKAPSRDPNAPALGEIIRSLKAASTTRIRKECLPDFKWQDGFWDRIVRNDAELDRYRGYIATNPERWTLDREYVDQ